MNNPDEAEPSIYEQATQLYLGLLFKQEGVCRAFTVEA